jgi:hypothetical protein
MSERLPHLPSPDSFFQQEQKHTISNFREGILRGGAYAPPVLKQGVHMHPLPYGSARLCSGYPNKSVFMLRIKGGDEKGKGNAITKQLRIGLKW